MSYSVQIERAPEATPVLFWSTFFESTSFGAVPLGDWRIAPKSGRNAGGLDESDPLGTAVSLSLFTDRRAPEGWRPEEADRRGWWGDGAVPAGENGREDGSWLWLLRRETVTDDAVRLAKAYAEQALQWLIDENVASRIEVRTGTIEQPRRGIWLDIEIIAPSGAQVFNRKFARLWDVTT